MSFPIKYIKHYGRVLIELVYHLGYAQATADEGTTEAYCTNAGWAPSMLYWPKCVAGCSDVTSSVEHGYTLSAPSTTAGKPPFVTGKCSYSEVSYRA